MREGSLVGVGRDILPEPMNCRYCRNPIHDDEFCYEFDGEYFHKDCREGGD